MNAGLNAGDAAPDFAFETPWEDGKTFYQAAGGRPAVIVFSRYMGCPICQLYMDDLRRDIDLFKSKGAEVFFVLQSPTSTVASLTGRDDWPFRIVCDPKGLIYELYKVRAGNPLKLLNPALLKALSEATSRGFKHGKFEGKETQLPAAFVMDRDKAIVFAHYGKNPADAPTPTVLASALP